MNRRREEQLRDTQETASSVSTKAAFAFARNLDLDVILQASRRSWRIGQSQPVRVVFMSYRSTLQADALKLVAKRLQSSLAVEGELPEDGLPAYGGDGDDLLMALARKIVSGDGEADPETVEDVFAAALDAGSKAEELLVDADWRPIQVEPLTVKINGNGHQDPLGPTVELVPVYGRNGNGHHEEADGPQKSLFSWAEFIATDPTKTKGRRSRPLPASMSMFEWAFEQE